MIKLIASDMDGSLLDDKKNLSKDFWDVERKLSEKGIIFCAASGRQFANLFEKFQKAGDRMVFMAENGAYVVRNNELIHCNAFNSGQAVRFIKTAREIPNTYIVLCCEDSAYIENNDIRFRNEIDKYYNRVTFVDDLTQVEKPVLKLSFCDFDNAEKNSINYFRSYQDDYKVVVAGRLFLDIAHKETNKGNALRIIQKKFNILPEETLAFGDYHNDLEMLEAAKYSFAMKNAHPDIIKMASFVTEFDNNNDGVIDIIKKYCLNGH